MSIQQSAGSTLTSPQLNLSPVMKVNPSVIIGSNILHNANFITTSDTREIYRYESTKGIYIPDGETYIEVQASTLLGSSYQSHIVNETKDWIRTKTYVDRTQLGTPKDQLIVSNGVLSINQRVLYPHDPRIFSLTYLPVNYDSTKYCPHFMIFLSETMSKKDIKILQEYLGYCFTRGYRHKFALLIQGPPNTGKTTLLKVVMKLFGHPNIASVSLQNLQERFYSAQLYGKMVNILDDLSSGELRYVHKFKEVTGDSQIMAENKNKDPFTFTNEAKLIFATNKIPKAPDPNDEAFFKRWFILKMDHQFEGVYADPFLSDKLTTPDELSGILNWALDGLDRLNQRGRFEDLSSSDEVKVEFGCGGSVGVFLKETTEADAKANISKEELYEEYVKFCETNDYASLGKDSFCKQVYKAANIMPTRMGSAVRVQAFRGIRMKGINSTSDTSGVFSIVNEKGVEREESQEIV